MKNLKISSPAFENNGWIPHSNSGYGEDISPELILEGIDENAVSIAITLDDAGHPLFPNYNHWVVWNLPPVNRIPGNLPKGSVIEKPIHLEQGVAYGKHCYRGPKPPFNWNHDYRFTVYVLDTKLSIDVKSKKGDVLKAMDGHVLQTGILMAKYQRRRK